jgi:hypothetical protein
MKRILAYAFLASSALIATGVSGCVREEIGPTNFHTSAYIEHDAPSGDEPQISTNAPPPPAPDQSDSSGDQSHH